MQIPYLFCYSRWPPGSSLDVLLRDRTVGKERDQKERGARQMEKPPDGSSCHRFQLITVSPFSVSPDQTTTRLTFRSVSSLLRLQMFINTCCNVISSWENTHQVTDADKGVKQMSPPCPSYFPPSQSWHTQEAGDALLPGPPSSLGRRGIPQEAARAGDGSCPTGAQQYARHCAVSFEHLASSHLLTAMPQIWSTIPILQM